MACGELCAAELLCADVECLAPEDAAVRARAVRCAGGGVCGAARDVVERVAKELVEGQHEEWQAVERGVAVHGLDAAVAVAADALVDAQQPQVEAQRGALVDGREHVRERRRVLAAADGHRDALALREKPCAAHTGEHAVLDPAHKARAAAYSAV